MSAIRLSISQPSSFELSDSANKEINKWIKKYPKDRIRSALIPALWIIQKDGHAFVRSRHRSHRDGSSSFWNAADGRDPIRWFRSTRL